MSKLSRWLVALGFCLLIFGAKLAFIDTAGSDLPSWDQWDAEGEVVLRPWLEGWLHPKEILHPHNEHRLVLTKLAALGLFIGNGQWDGFVETVPNALVHTLTALLLLHFGCRWLSGWARIAYGALIAVLFTLPFSWENTLFGFQSQFYFLLLFSLAHVWLSVEGDRFGWRWGLGQLAGVLALLSLASGFLSALAVLLVLAHRGVRERRVTLQQGVTAIIALALIVAGWMMKNEVPGHASLRAHGPVQFVVAFLELLAWPGSAWFPLSVVLALPAAAFVARMVRSRETTREGAVQLGLLAWVWLQSAATAYARGGSEAVLSPRYLDLLAVHVVLGFVFVNAGGWPRPAAASGENSSVGTRRTVLAALWLGAVLVGLAQQTRMMWRDFVAPNIARQHVQERNVRNYLRTGDASHLLHQPWGEVPYPVGEVLLQRLEVPVIQDIMPPSVRRSVPVAGGAPVPAPAGLPAPERPLAVSTFGPTPAPRLEWRSAVQPATSLPVLRFRVAGALGDPANDARVVVRSAAGDAPVAPDAAPGARWKTVNVFRPEGEWWIEASASAGTPAFAVTEPVEVGRWTWVAEKLLKHHAVIGGLGVVLLAAGLWPRGRRIAA